MRSGSVADLVMLGTLIVVAAHTKLQQQLECNFDKDLGIRTLTPGRMHQKKSAQGHPTNICLLQSTPQSSHIYVKRCARAT